MCGANAGLTDKVKLGFVEVAISSSSSDSSCLATVMTVRFSLLNLENGVGVGSCGAGQLARFNI